MGPDTTLDAALQPAAVQENPGSTYGAPHRQWQGIPGIERTAQGRLWVTWYSGGKGEGPDNYVLLVKSDDDGQSWSEPILVIDPPGQVRAFDPVLWHDPAGKLWLFWAQSEGWYDGRAGVWAIWADNPDEPNPSWSQPQRLADGIMMNKLTATSAGEWVLPICIWGHLETIHPNVPAEQQDVHIVVSSDQGQTWERRGSVNFPNRTHDEHMIVERRDGSLWMLIRLREGIGESLSTDGGHHWTPMHKLNWKHPDARFFIRRLQSGNLLFVGHHNPFKVGEETGGRSHLTAFLSTDDGQSWQGGLILDERPNISYPDGVQASDGHIFIIYDRDRSGVGEILTAVFTEADVLVGEPVGPETRLQELVHALGI